MKEISLESIYVAQHDQRALRAKRIYALAHPNRLHILEILAAAGEGDMSVEKINEFIPHVSQPTISHHIGILLNADIIYLKERRGLYHYYAINTALMEQIEEETFSRILRTETRKIRRPRKLIGKLA